MKIARVQISREYFEMIIKADGLPPPNRIITSNAPKDLEVLGFTATRDFPFTFDMYCKSESFAEIAEGAEPPLISPFIYTVKEIEA